MARCLPRHKRGALGTALSAPACARDTGDISGHAWPGKGDWNTPSHPKKGELGHPHPPKKGTLGTPLSISTQERDMGTPLSTCTQTRDTSVHPYQTRDISVHPYPKKGHWDIPDHPNKRYWGHLCPLVPEQGTPLSIPTQTRDTSVHPYTKRDTGTPLSPLPVHWHFGTPVPRSSFAVSPAAPALPTH